MELKNMKVKPPKTLLLLTTLLTCVLMVSTATALPVTTSEPVMEIVQQNDQLKTLFNRICELQESDMPLQEKQKMMLGLFESEDIAIDNNILGSIVLILSILLTLLISPLVLLFSFLYGFIRALQVLITNTPADLVNNIFEVFLLAFAYAGWMVYYSFLTIEILLINIIEFFYMPQNFKKSSYT